MIVFFLGPNVLLHAYLGGYKCSTLDTSDLEECYSKQQIHELCAINPRKEKSHGLEFNQL